MLDRLLSRHPVGNQSVDRKRPGATYNESSQASQAQEVRFITGRPELWSRGGHSHLWPMWSSASWVGDVAVVLASEKYTQLLTGPC